jgi:class 3 adenylate cyclase/tetratricopeptide (TPR) repeat protein
VLTCLVCGKENPDGFKFCGFCTASLTEASSAREQRKTVTVLFCDVTGSTELGERLDPEALRALLARYFVRMGGIVERHGGTVEKFIGDAVMAVFGVPAVHEDDALRALRAAVEMRAAFPELGVQGRIGVTTGEVVTGTAERLATGDAVNIAARLEQAAEPGEILIGEATLRLARDAVEVEPVEPLALKGKADPVRAYRLLSAGGEEGSARHLEGPIVGRETELRRLADAFGQALSGRSCQLFTILGTAGVGKSRLVAEFLGSLDGALVIRGRCLPYGEGITYWPVVEVLKQLPPTETDPVAAKTIRALVENEPLVASSDEIAWAFRKLLETVAAETPVVCVFDDVHWGEQTFLDLVEHVADLSRDAPILLLCMARPDLLDRRTGWAGGKVNATSVLLEPLAPEETEQLIESLAHLDDDLRRRILDAAEGNPLYIEEMVALVQESGGGEITVPPTIRALLAARLDQLDVFERDVLERGAVEGRVFHRGAVQALAPEDSQLTARLSSLVRKELVRPDKSELAREDAFRFRHLLIRDAAYGGLPKAARAELHERFADWLAEHGRDLVELDEILGYHLEQACRFRAELGVADDGSLAVAALRRLEAAGRRALLRSDVPAAVNLLQRALALVPAVRFETILEVDLLEAVFLSGRVGDAYRLAAGSVARAGAAGDRAGELCARIKLANLRTYVEPEGSAEQLAAIVEEALPVFEASGYDFGLYVAYSGLRDVAHQRGRMDSARDALEQAIVHGEQAGLPHLVVGLMPARGASRLFGSTPASELLDWLDEQDRRGAHALFSQLHRAQALAMIGHFADARSSLANSRAQFADRGLMIPLALATGHVSVEVELLAGDPAAAVELGVEGCRLLEQAGEQGWLSTAVGYLAEALYQLDRLDEADEATARAAELGAGDDAITQMLWRQVAAKVRARRGDPLEAERLAREAVAIGAETDMVDARGDSHADLAEVLMLAGRDDEAQAALKEARALFDLKGNLVMLERMNARLRGLRRADWLD